MWHCPTNAAKLGSDEHFPVRSKYQREHKSRRARLQCSGPSASGYMGAKSPRVPHAPESTQWPRPRGTPALLRPQTASRRVRASPLITAGARYKCNDFSTTDADHHAARRVSSAAGPHFLYTPDATAHGTIVRDGRLLGEIAKASPRKTLPLRRSQICRVFQEGNWAVPEDSIS